MSFDTIAVLGLGIIGSRAASHLAKAARVKTWNRTPKGLPDEAASVEDAVADADLVLLYLKDAPAVREVAARVFAAPARERVLVNHATVDLPTTRWLADECAARGIGFLDCPFTGSREAAAGGALVYYAGGPDELIDRVEPVLLHTAKSVLRCGAAGTATVMKLVTNLISACTVQALAESLATATRHGISPEALTHAVSLNACGSVLASMKLPTMAKGEFDTHFSLSNMLKDSRYVLDLAAEAGLETPAIRTVSQRMQELCDQGLADRDYSALAAPYVQP
ncbi:NAD(P)-dependent oxidoreductase [Luteolibacter arcticus]|uniref:NAD(P)-dependent oxidoreductase n=1 Tax=Luteolibacter arcticus TaxID=1581411 RepID=A0ABT3GRC5_9BACT|nr:NAD(P)-dependent oxidoreductase [Luteolibacter arcticus]MCW1926054.1 NAD(P)-dependent oxidoreductase [Luteolibacter arcticus]